LNERGALAVIPTNASRAGIIPYDKEIYKWRHLVENFFQKIKESPVKNLSPMIFRLLELRVGL
jgi:hypothetical protein